MHIPQHNDSTTIILVQLSVISRMEREKHGNTDKYMIRYDNRFDRKVTALIFSLLAFIPQKRTDKLSVLISREPSASLMRQATQSSILSFVDEMYYRYKFLGSICKFVSSKPADHGRGAVRL